MITQRLVEIGDAISTIELHKTPIKALHVSGKNFDPKKLTRSYREFTFNRMLFCINHRFGFECICYCCHKFVYYRYTETDCPFNSDECPIHEVFKCSICMNEYDMTIAPEDIDFLININVKELLW